MNLLVKLSGDLKKWADKEVAFINKAINGALYEATYTLYREGWRGLKMGKLDLIKRRPLIALKKLSPEQREGLRFWKGLYKGSVPLAPLYSGILYRVDKVNKTGKVGFIASEIGGGKMQIWAEKAAELHAMGYNLFYTERHREWLHLHGVHLKKNTTSANVPSRDIIDMINKKYGSIALEKLSDSFQRKMAGERT